MLSGFALRTHIAFEHVVDLRLVALSRSLEIGQHETFDTQGDLFSEIRFNEFRPLPEGLVQLRNITEVDVLVLRGRDLSGCEGFIISAHGKPAFSFKPCRMGPYISPQYEPHAH